MRAWMISLFLLGACASAPKTPPPERAAIDAHAAQWLAETGVASFAVAFIQDGEVAWTAAYGEQSAGVPATPDTLYNVASLAKPISAETMLRLVSAGELSLDEPMSAHWVDPDIADDPRRDALTLRVALSHRTGFPNWRRATGGTLTFQSPPGEGFTYSGEGYQYARRYAEAATGEAFQALAQRMVFAPSGMRHTTYIGAPWLEGHIAVPHDEHGVAGEPDIGAEANAADDLYTTVGDYARFVRAVMRNDGVSAEIARQRLDYTFELRDGGCGGDTGLSMEDCPDSVGMGMGWMTLRYGDERVITHSGSDTGEQTIALFVPERRIGVVIFTNSANGRRIFPLVVAQLYDNPHYLALLRVQGG